MTIVLFLKVSLALGCKRLKGVKCRFLCLKVQRRKSLSRCGRDIVIAWETLCRSWRDTVTWRAVFWQEIPGNIYSDLFLLLIILLLPMSPWLNPERRQKAGGFCWDFYTIDFRPPRFKAYREREILKQHYKLVFLKMAGWLKMLGHTS